MVFLRIRGFMKTTALQSLKQKVAAQQPRINPDLPPVLSLMSKQVICVASLTHGSGKSLFTSSLAHLLTEQGLKVDLFDSRIGALHHGCQTASPIVLVEMSEGNLWYHIASDILLIADPTRSNGSLLREASLFLDLMAAEERSMHVRIVVNRAEDLSQAREVYRQIRKEAETRPLIHLKFFGYLPCDPVLEAWKTEKNPFVVDYPEGMAAACLRSMAARFKDQYQIWKGT